MPLRRGETAKLPPDQEEALLQSLRIKREQVARAKLQTEAQAVARKLGDMEIEKLADEAMVLATKDRKNFGNDQNSAVAAITLNAVFLAASRAKEEDPGASKGKGKGGYNGAAPKKSAGGGGKKNAAPKIGAKVERLPPPSFDAAKSAITKYKKTLTNVSKFENGQLELLRAFESWLLIEQHESVLPDTSKLLEVLCEEGLIENKVLSEYWANVQSAYKLDGVELIAAQAQSKEASDDHLDAAEKLKVAEKDMLDATQRLKWAAMEVQAARTGNNPNKEEIAREKAANTNEVKERALKLQQTKVVEMCHKRQVTCLNVREAADRTLAERTAQMRPLVMINTHARAFFESIAPAGDGAK